jgi:hypothetical protein
MVGIVTLAHLELVDPGTLRLAETSKVYPT